MAATSRVCDQYVSEQAALYCADNVETVDGLPDNSVGLVITSIPFPGMYAFTSSDRDIGNCKDRHDLVAHLRFLVSGPKLLRAMMPGRSCVIHLTQEVAFKGTDGFIGLWDFRGDVIRLMQDEGWIFYGEVAVAKDPQVKAIRTKDRGLLFKTLANDSSQMHMCLNDYLLQFVKPGDNPAPIRAGISQKYGNSDGWITSEEWINWACGVWTDIRETDVLNVRQAKDADDEKHLCPLQLSVIERCIKLWSNPGDVVLDPFMGIGSTPYEAVLLKRKGVGIELKPSYYKAAVRNVREAEGRAQAGTLFSLLDASDDQPEVADDGMDECLGCGAAILPEGISPLCARCASEPLAGGLASR